MVVVELIFSPQTVDLPDALDGEERVLDDVVVDVRGGRLQQDAQGLAQDADGGGEHEDAEEEGADGVDEVPFRLEVDHDGCDEDAKGLEEISNNVDEGSSHVDVLLVGNFMGMPAFLVMTMTMTIFCILGTTASMCVSMSSSTTAAMTMAMLVQCCPHHNVDRHPDSRSDEHYR